MALSRTASHPATTIPVGHKSWIRDFTSLHIDIGTGDGVFALHMARTCPEGAVVGLDTNLDNLAKAVRRPPPNLRFVSGDAIAPPHWLLGRAGSVSINFPYGALFRAIARDDDGLVRMLAVARPGARVDIRINASAGASNSVPIERVSRQVKPLVLSIGVESGETGPEVEQPFYKPL